MISSFTATRDPTGRYEIFTVNVSGATYTYLEGKVPFRGPQVEIPYEPEATITLVARNQYGHATATATER